MKTHDFHSEDRTQTMYPVPQAGFSLLELMIAVSILAIIMAIAVPTYQEQTMKARRSDAQTSLLEAAQTLERCYTETNVYNDGANCPAVTGGDLSPAYKASNEGYYTLSATALTASTFTLQAVADGLPQSKDSDCTALTIDQTGRKGATGGADEPAQDCWR